jgi:hypothetical protein
MALQHVETLYERDEALSAIDQRIEALRGGDGSVLALEAAAGVGKTTLRKEKCHLRTGGVTSRRSRYER